MICACMHEQRTDERRHRKRCRPLARPEDQRNRDSDVPAFLLNPNVFPAARTVVTLLLAMNVHLLLELLVAGREADLLLDVGGRGLLVLTFPSDALFVSRELEIRLDVGLGSGSVGYFAAPIRRGEDAEGNRNASVKVQVDD